MKELNETLPGHTFVGKQTFRLQSRAFLLTFNCLAFVASWELWSAFLEWIKERAERFKAKVWSCTLEESQDSSDEEQTHRPPPKILNLAPADELRSPAVLPDEVAEGSPVFNLEF